MRRKQPYNRPDRFGQHVQRELANILLKGPLRDPDARPVIITHVGMSKDLRVANINVQVHAEGEEKVKAVEALQRAAGFLRRKLAPRLSSRSIPELRFHLDDTLDEVDRLAQLLQNLETNDHESTLEPDES
ncbi:MAG: ribosome-binding factor A [Myxococcales bacterium]|nr:ribosome-binding factor A [Myxococcales bacterium]